MNVRKKLQAILHRPAVTVRELQDTGVVQVVNPGRLNQPEVLVHELEPESHNRDGCNVCNPIRTKQALACNEIRSIRPARKSSLGNIRAVQKMKHGYQSQMYRRSVKANVKPEED